MNIYLQYFNVVLLSAMLEIALRWLLSVTASFTVLSSVHITEPVGHNFWLDNFLTATI